MPRGEFDRATRRAQTRARLLEAAAAVYARRGFDGATVDEVAAEAGLTKGAVYDHFGSKEKLLLAVLDEHLSTQIAEQISLFDPETEATERPRIGADRWMDELDEDPTPFRLLLEAWVKAQRDPVMLERVAAGLRAWLTTLEAFGSQDEAREQSPEAEVLLEQLANLMLAWGLGLGMIKLIDPDRVPSRLLGAAYVLLLRTLDSSEEARALLAQAQAQAQASAPSTDSSARLRSTPPV